MTRYADGKQCLRATILSYFGEATPPQCGNCSVCCVGQPDDEQAQTARVRRGRRDALAEGERALYERLVTLRKRIARTRSVPAFIIFSDATLREMARKRPQTRAQLLRVSGVGEKKFESYGQKFIDEITAYAKQMGASNE